MNSINDWHSSKKYKLLKLHLGCGSKYLEGYCNIDNNPLVGGEDHRGNDLKVDIYSDMKMLNCADSTVDIIFCSHVIEHFSFSELEIVFSEFKRVLKQGGIIVIETPNMNSICLLFLINFLQKKIKPKGHYLSHSLSDSVIYGAYWEEKQAPYAVHKFVWRLGDLIKFSKHNGFNYFYSTGATQFHVPYRDFCLIISKGKRLVEFDDFIARYFLFSWKIKSFLSFIYSTFIKR